MHYKERENAKEYARRYLGHDIHNKSYPDMQQEYLPGPYQIGYSDNEYWPGQQYGVMPGPMEGSYETDSHERSIENDWAVPSTDVESCGSNPLSELLSLASREAALSSGEREKHREENIYEPPNSPQKDPFYYLKEIAETEASRMQKRYRTGPMNEEESLRPHLLPPVYAVMENSPQAAVVNYASGATRPVKSFNDFDEGIFTFDHNTGLYKCPHPHCTKEFPSLCRIKRHFIIHTNIKPFKCPNKDCGRTFSRKDNMLQHYRVHCPFSSQN